MLTPLPWRLRAYSLHSSRWLLLLVLWLVATGSALAQTVTIGSTAVPVVAPATSTYLYGPIYRSAATSNFDYSRYVHLYTATELGVPAGSVITELAWLKSDAGEITGNNVFNVLLNNTATSNLATGTTWGAATTGATSVYASTTQQFTGAAGTYISVTLNQPFVYTGGNLLVAIDHQKLGTASAAVNFVTNPAAGLAIGTANSTPLTATTALTTASYGDRRPTMRITYTPATACTAPPTAGTTLSSATSICTGNSVSLNLQGASYGTGMTYQWQQSTDGITYTDITGATGFTYTTPILTATRYYRARLTCSGQSATSAPVQVTVVQVSYASLPVIQSFENTWLDVCDSHDAANANWRTNPSSGNTAWRRDDDGATAGWTSPTVGVYAPTASQGSRSARFHSYYAGAGGVGSLNLYVNLSTAGGKRLAFDYINTAGNDSLLVSVSNDGGVTFGAPVLRLGVSGTVAQGFRPQTVTLTGTSATSVVRFTGKVTTTFTTDIGVDDVRIESLSSCLSPLALAVTGTTANSAVVSWASTGTGPYTVFYGPTGFTPGGTGSQQLTATGTTATITGLTASTEYQFYVRQTCGTSFSGNAGPVTFRTDCLTPLYATLPVVESFENTWISRCDTRDVPTNNWRNSPATGNNSWRREDDGVGGAWVSPTSWSYTPTGSNGTHSARFHSGQATSGLVGTLDLFVNLSTAGAKQLSFDYINTTGNDSLTVHLSTDGGITFGPALLRRGIAAATGYTSQTLLLNSTSATAVLRFRARSDFGTTDIGLDNIRLESAAGCTTPINLTTTSTTATTALVSWQGTNSGTYTVFYGTVGFTPGGAGSQQITGVTGTTATITGLTASTDYEFYVRQNCGASSSANAGPATFRTACVTPTYATLPVVESFENTWLSRCDTREVPSNNWRNTPATGNNSWRRDDDGVAANWTSPASGIYTPTSSQGSQSARFHTYFASAGTIGTLDLFVNLSLAGNKRLTFDYINTTASSTTRADTLTVHLSTDGGATFGPALLSLLPNGTGSGWVNQVLPITSTSATAVIRFRVNSDFGLTDVGLDNVRVESATGCLTPAGLTVPTTTTTTAVLNWVGAGSGTYNVQYGPAGFAPGSGTTVTATGSPFTITGLQPGTQYQFYVSQNCGTTQSGLAGPVGFTTQIINDDPCGAITLTLGTDCTVPVQTTNAGATATTPNGYTNGGTGNCGPATLTTPKDVWFKFRTNAANRGATEVTLTVTGAPANVVRVFSGSACGGPLTPVTGGCAASVSATSAAPVLALTGLTPSTDYYVQVSGYTNTATLGNFTMCAVAPSSCPLPVGPAATTLTATTATLTWAVNTSTPSGTFTVEYGAPNFTVGTGTRLMGITSLSTTLTGLTADTQYCFYVRQECNAANGTSAFTGPICFRTALGPATNDEPCNATVLTAGAVATNATNLGATTTTPSGYQNPGCSTASAPKDVWFRFVAPTGGNAQLAVTGNPAGQVRVFSAASCNGPFTALACQASTGPNTPAGPLNVTGLTPGTTYYASVSGFGSSDFTGAFTIRLLSVLSTGTGQLAQGEVNLYPNPSHDGTLNLAIRGAGAVTTVQAVLLNSLGQQVLTQAVPVQAGRADKALPVQNLAKGLYTLRLQVGQTVITRKVVLE